MFAVVGCCFKRYLGLANGISVAGVSVGQMVFPSLITTLNTTYGARGGGVIMAAICLHLLITAALMPRHIIDPDAPVVPAEKVETGKSKRKSCKSQSKSKEDKQLIASEDLLNADKQSTAIDLDKKLQSPVDEFFSKLDNQR